MAILGILGLSLLAVGWLTEAVKIIRDKKANIEVKFAILYVIGSLLLTAYSFQIGDMIFMILNALVALFSLLSLFYAVKYRK